MCVCIAYEQSTGKTKYIASVVVLLLKSEDEQHTIGDGELFMNRSEYDEGH